MNKSEEIIVDENIRPYLDEIAEKLWSTPSHAAIMVGSGFSKNANINFPDWAALGDLFFEKIHGRKPDQGKKEDRYLNPLKLADELQAAFGRSVLDQLLRNSIPDKDSELSKLHVDLLQLPWSDVFTTNYDTLLDRACDLVPLQKYDIVINKDDLIYSEKPRIIKLHGSFPSERPFIITEEDYRTYPEKYAPFVNTVQQSLLENTLCLIGFSGDDPNFLSWIGWIRDNLGKSNSPRIYLVGIINISEAQKKLLEQRNIVLVDLSSCSGRDKSHFKGLDSFFRYLFSRKNEDSRLDWPGDYNHISPPKKDSEILFNIKNIVDEWRNIRLLYPNWLIAPGDSRNILWDKTQPWINWLSVNDDLSDILVLEYCFELNWRLERCLCHIMDKVSELFITVINNYWPFKDKCPYDPKYSFSDENFDNFDWDQIRNMWLKLSFALQRYYRECGKFNEWNSLNLRLKSVYEKLSPNDRANFHYECALFYLFKFSTSLILKSHH